MIDGESGQSAKSPARAILLQSPGRKPWVNRRNTFIEPCKGGTTPRQMLAPKVPLLRSSIRSCPCLPRVAFRALPSLHPGLCRSVVPTALTPAPPNKSDSKRKQRDQTINPTTNANNDIAQPIRQQVQTTTPNNN